MGMQTRMIQAWIARDDDGELYHYSEMPIRNDNGAWSLPNLDAVAGALPPKMFPEITWEDEPRKVEISIKLL